VSAAVGLGCVRSFGAPREENLRSTTPAAFLDYAPALLPCLRLSLFLSSSLLLSAPFSLLFPFSTPSFISFSTAGAWRFVSCRSALPGSDWQKRRLRRLRGVPIPTSSGRVGRGWGTLQRLGGAGGAQSGLSRPLLGAGAAKTSGVGGLAVNYRVLMLRPELLGGCLNRGLTTAASRRAGSSGR